MVDARHGHGLELPQPPLDLTFDVPITSRQVAETNDIDVDGVEGGEGSSQLSANGATN